MTLKLVPIDHGELCHGWAWFIDDEDALAEQVARIVLGQYRHVAKILSGAGVPGPAANAKQATAAIKQLTLVEGEYPWHRDGWLFQAISWIAAHQQPSASLTRMPHIRKADKGFDGMQLELNEAGTSVTAVVVFEDKATDKARDTIRDDVWPGIVALEKSERLNELSQEVSGMLDARAKLFKGFDESAPGAAARRRADTIYLPVMRSWMAGLLSSGRSKGGNWYLTPNGNETSSAIAAAAASAGMKPLVFVQTTVFCESCVKNYPARVAASQITLTEEEQEWRTLAEEEMGGSGYCYMKLSADGTLQVGTASHHALLLREERELHESLFRRPDGIKVLFATSTLAQGMNLPSEAVIISGDSRFDPQADKMQKLEAHELLNAAGRAGRAGEGAQGFVLLVPSKVIDFDDQNNQINGHWMELQAIFEQADQCLVIDDPLKVVLDRIHDGVTQTGASAYLLSKLPLAVAGSEDDPAALLLNRSFSAYRALVAADADWLSTRVATRFRQVSLFCQKTHSSKLP